MRWIFEPGFWTNQSVRTALLVGAIAAIVSGVVGTFTVLRGQSFAGHALADVATAGGAGSFLAGLSPLLGFVVGGVLGAGAMDAIGVAHVKSRDVATGVVLGAATGLAALFLYVSSTRSAANGTTQRILFGSLFTVSATTVLDVAALSAAVLLSLTLIGRPLLFSSLHDDLAAARGVRRRVVSLGFMLSLAVAVGVTAIVIGSILSTALLVGPAAAALQLARRFRNALLGAVALGVVATLLGIVMAYDSYYWFSSHRGLPVSFFVVALVVAEFVVASTIRRVTTRRSPRALSPRAIASAARGS